RRICGCTEIDMAEIDTAKDPKELREPIMAALSTVYDPEVPVNIVEFGLVYGLDIAPDGQVNLTMSLTSPSCPSAASIPKECETKILAVPGVKGCNVNVVWDPPWGAEMISPTGRKKLGMDVDE
ncbi:MAG TPA: iron-sulfur cluster assembly protein, partial [Planctomycetota bacterium]|nr:iron-sulfur cluster assembly protein [Planctomycetota bacterium]